MTAEELAKELEKYSLMLVAEALLINWRKQVWATPKANGFCYYRYANTYSTTPAYRVISSYTPEHQKESGRPESRG